MPLRSTRCSITHTPDIIHEQHPNQVFFQSLISIQFANNSGDPSNESIPSEFLTYFRRDPQTTSTTAVMTQLAALPVNYDLYIVFIV